MFLGVAAFDYRNIARLGYVVHAVGVAMLVGVLLFGKMVGGGRRWFDLGPFHLQPSELMQLLTIVALGKYLNDSPALEGRTWRHLAIPVLIVSVPALLIAKQPDFGTAFLLLLIFISDHDDRAPEAEDAGRHHGPGDHRGVPDLPAPAARVSAQARRGVLQPQLGRAPTRRGRR